MNRSRLYTLLGIAAIAAVLLLGWFGAVSPQLTQIGSAEDQIVTVQAQNAALTQTLATLKSDGERLPELQKQLDALRVQVPQNEGIEALARELQSLADSNGVQLLNLKIPPTVAYPANAGTTGTTTSATAPGSTTPTAAATPTPQPTALPTAAPTPTTTTTTSTTDLRPSATLAPNLFMINITMSVSGPLDGIIAFTNALQTGQRLFLVTTVNLNNQGAGGAGTATVGGYAFVLSSATARAAAAAAAAGTTTSTATPTPSATSTPTPSVTSTPTPSTSATPAG